MIASRQSGAMLENNSSLYKPMLISDSYMHACLVVLVTSSVNPESSHSGVDYNEYFNMFIYRTFLYFFANGSSFVQFTSHFKILLQPRLVTV
jgi:hypothetical protein